MSTRSAIVGFAVLIAFARPAIAAPVANAGPDLTGDEGTSLYLDGRGSHGTKASPLASIVWTQVSGPAARLGNPSYRYTSVRLPQVTPAGATLEFRITVTDTTGASASDAALVTVRNVPKPPVTLASVPGKVDDDQLVYLNGKRSYDPDGTSLTFQWRQVGGPAVEIVDPTSAVAKFRSPNAPASATLKTGQLTSSCSGCVWLSFELTTQDESGMQSSATTQTYVAHDATPPSLTGFSIDTPTVDLGADPATPIAVRMAATDDLAGMKGLGASFHSPNGKQFVGFSSQISGRPLSWSGAVSTSSSYGPYTQPGTWSLSGLQILDAAGNVGDLTSDQVGALGYPTSFEVSNAAYTPDEDAPVLVSFTSGAAVDIDADPNAVAHVRASMSDNATGLYQVELTCMAPSGHQSTVFRRKWTDAPTSWSGQMSGTALRGVNTEGGVWHLIGVYLRDSAGNDRQSSELLGTTCFEVRNSAWVPDTEGPQISAVSLDTPTIDIDQGQTLVSISLSATDQTGIAAADFRFISPDGQTYRNVVASPNGAQTWTGTATAGWGTGGWGAPSDAQPGQWNLLSVQVDDVAGNYRFYYPNDIAAMGGATSFEVINSGYAP